MTASKAPAAGARQRRNRRDEVIEAAIRVFHKKGYASASIQDVADEVGVLKGSLYHYIDSKEDLLARIFEDSAGHFTTMVEEASGLDERPVERLRSFAHTCSLWYLQNIERVTIYVTEWKHLTGKKLKEVVLIREDYERRLAGLIGEVVEAGEATPGPRRQLRHLLHLRRPQRAAHLVPAARPRLGRADRRRLRRADRRDRGQRPPGHLALLFRRLEALRGDPPAALQLAFDLARRAARGAGAFAPDVGGAQVLVEGVLGIARGAGRGRRPRDGRPAPPRRRRGSPAPGPRIRRS